MEIREAIRTRRSVRPFTNRPISRADVERPPDSRGGGSVRTAWLP